MQSVLQELQEWYLAHCDGDWEHRYGVDIGNIDNPGWMFNVELAGTELADVPFAEFRENFDDEVDWLICGKEGTKFSGNGGPLQLERLIGIFLEWAKSSTKPQLNAVGGIVEATETQILPAERALIIAQTDAVKAYRDLSLYRIRLELKPDGWHIDYELKAPQLKGGGPHYVIDRFTGAILSRRYEQ